MPPREQQQEIRIAESLIDNTKLVSGLLKMSEGGKYQNFKKFRFDKQATKILEDLFGEELHDINERTDQVSLVPCEGVVLLKAATSSLLATTKQLLDKKVAKVVNECKDVSLAVQSKEECDIVEKYLKKRITKKKLAAEVTYITGQKGNATTFRFYSKDREKAIEIRNYIEQVILQRNIDLPISNGKPKTVGVEDMSNRRPPSVRNKRRNRQENTLSNNKSASVHLPEREMPSNPHGVVKPKVESVIERQKMPIRDSKDDISQKLARAASLDESSSRDESGNIEKRYSDNITASHTHEFYMDANTQGTSIGSSDPHHQMTYDKSISVHGLTIRFALIPLTKIPVDAIVNAANENFSNGAGVAWAIRQEAGKAYQKECEEYIKKNGKVAVSETAVTKAHKLKNCKWVINAVGPDWDNYTDKEKALKDLSLTIENVLDTASEKKTATVAMPPISSGIYGFPKEACAAMYSKGVLDYTWKGTTSSLKEVIFVDINDSTILDLTFKCLSQVSSSMGIKIKDVLKSLPKESPLRGAEGGVLKADKSRRKSTKATSNTNDRLCSHTKEEGVDIFNFKNSAVVLVYTKDIIRLSNVDILVTPESRSFKGDGILARKIAESAGNDYIKDRRKYDGQQKQAGEILITSAGNLKFQKIFHVILSRFDDRGPPSETQLKQYKSLIKDVLTRANDLNNKKLKLKSIAMPLLGTGHIRDQWLLTSIGGAVLDGIYLYSKSSKLNVKEIHLVNINEETTGAICKVFLNEATGQLRHAEEERMTDMEERSRPADKPKDAVTPLDVWKTNTKDKAVVDLESCIVEKGNLAIIDDEVSDDTDNSCVVCMEPMDQPVILRDCGHQFCRECIMDYFSRKPSCPMCNTMYGKLYGDQPGDAVANVYLEKYSLPGHGGHGTIIIDYDIPNGRQNDQHPNPGMPYRGFRRTAFLPDTKEGQKVLSLLKEAFTQGLIFTIGYSRTTGKDNVLTWNDIHHKTRREGGPQRFGYPDPEYIPRVTEELAAKGIR